jgi:hypothetical protein
MIAWLRRIFAKKASKELSPAEIACKLTQASDALHNSEQESKRALDDLTHKLLLAPSAMHRISPVQVLGRPIDWAKHIGDIEELARNDVEKANQERDDALSTVREYERKIEAESEACAAWRSLCDAVDKSNTAAHQVLNDAKVPAKPNLAERIEWLVKSRQRARDARDSGGKRKK